MSKEYPFDGTWKLNPEKSQFDPNHRPQNATMRWERTSDGYAMTAEGIAGDNAANVPGLHFQNVGERARHRDNELSRAAVISKISNGVSGRPASFSIRVARTDMARISG